MKLSSPHRVRRCSWPLALALLGLVAVGAPAAAQGPPDSVLAPDCAAGPVVHVYRARHSAAELERWQSRIIAAIGEPGTRWRGHVAISGDSLVVGAQNQAARERARARLVREDGLPMRSVSFTIPPGPQELDGPISPSRDAVLAVLDSVAAHVHAAGSRAVVDLATLPGSIGPAELRARDLSPRDRSHPCGEAGVVSFLEPRQDTEGVYTFTVVEGVWPDRMAGDYVYRVRCGAEGCRVLHAIAGGGDYITGCPAAR